VGSAAGVAEPLPLEGLTAVGILGVGVLTAGVVGVGAVVGIFGGLTIAPGTSGLTVVGVPIFVVGVPVTPGVAGVATAGGGTCATDVATRREEPPLLNAAYAAVAAPATSTATAPRMTAAERQLGARECRLSGAPAPHCKHQS
jgi:hypothetical protein